jgi:hypothetical protein
MGSKTNEQKLVSMSEFEIPIKEIKDSEGGQYSRVSLK